MQFYSFWFENTSQGKSTLANAFTQGKYYSDNLSDIVTRAMRRKRADGVWPGFAPIGFMNDRNRRSIVPDPVRGPLVRKAFEIYAAEACTLEELKRTVNALGLTSRPSKKLPSLPLSRAQYHRLLRNPLYYGLIDHGGEVCEGRHEPLISKSLFDRVQEIIAGKRKPRLARQVKPYLYRRVFHCGECGGVITIETQKGNIYLRCTKKKGPCSQPFVREEEVTQQVTDTLARLVLPQGLIDETNALLTGEIGAERANREEDRKNIRQKVAENEAKQRRINHALAEGALELDEFREIKTGLVQEKTVLKEQVAAAEKNSSYWLEPTQRFVNSLTEATLTVSAGRPAEKLKLLTKTGSNLKIQDRRIQVEFRDAWKIVEKHGRIAQPPPAPRSRGAALVGKSADVSHVAERGRFELPLPLRADRFSKPAHSTTLPPLRGGRGV